MKCSMVRYLGLRCLPEYPIRCFQYKSFNRLLWFPFLEDPFLDYNYEKCTVNAYLWNDDSYSKIVSEHDQEIPQ